MRDLRGALAVLRDVARASQGTRPLADVLAQMCREIADGFGFERVSISRLDEQARSVRTMAAYGVRHDAIGRETPLDGVPLLDRALREQRLIFVADATEDDSVPSDLVEEFGVVSLFIAPLLSCGACLGFLSGDRAGSRFELDPTEVDVLQTAAVLAGTLLEKALVADELQRLDEAKNSFVAFAAHELRTPIQAVYGMLATVSNRGDELSHEQLVQLRSSTFVQAARLRSLADQLLDLSRLDAAAYRVEIQPVVVRRAVEETVLLIAEQRASDVAIEIPADLEVRLDPKMLDRVVANLIGNALRYGKPPVEVAAERRDRHFRLRVTDDGPGVPEEYAATLFDRFARAPTSAGTEGSGLGLAIAQSYARAHGGDLLYRRADPHGACFELVLPVDES